MSLDTIDQVPSGSAACLQVSYHFHLTRASFFFDTGGQYVMVS
jgi:hypothetical protein